LSPPLRALRGGCRINVVGTAALADQLAAAIKEAMLKVRQELVAIAAVAG
jgi:hypothetical protein